MTWNPVFSGKAALCPHSLWCESWEPHQVREDEAHYRDGETKEVSSSEIRPVMLNLIWLTFPLFKFRIVIKIKFNRWFFRARHFRAITCLAFQSSPPINLEYHSIIQMTFQRLSEWAYSLRLAFLTAALFCIAHASRNALTYGFINLDKDHSLPLKHFPLIFPLL